MYIKYTKCVTIRFIIIVSLLLCRSVSYISKCLRIGADSGSSDTTYLMLLFHQVKCIIKNVLAFPESLLVITLGALLEFVLKQFSFEIPTDLVILNLK